MKEATNSYKSWNTIAQYFGYIKEDYWHINYETNENFDFKNYYWDLRKKYKWFDGKLDANSIPLYLGNDGRYYYSVIFLGHYALGAYEDYLMNGDKNSLKDFLKIADWLKDNQEKYRECEGIWVNRYSMKTFNLKNEWASGLAQAKGISCLTRAFLETQDDEYLDAACKASKAYFTKVSKGGVVYEKGDFFCLEEYTTDGNSSVLNGFIFSIWSLFDLVNALKVSDTREDQCQKLEKLLNKCLVSLEKNFNLWEFNCWSRYDIWGKHTNIASYFYHYLHIKQLRILYTLTENRKFEEIALKWEKQRKNLFFSFLSLIKKVYFRLKVRS